MFIALLALLILAALVHATRSTTRGRERTRELLLVYLLAGYCGLPMLVVGVLMLVAPERAAAMLDAAPGNVFQEFFAWAYLGMAAAASLAIWLRGRFLIGPAVCWILYFLGATWIHLSELAVAGRLSAHGVLLILATHTVVPLLLLVLLLWPAPLRGSRPPGAPLGA